METGLMSMFTGYSQYSDFIVTQNHIKWATDVIILDKYFIRETLFKELYIPKEKIVYFHIEDEPQEFKDKLTELLMLLDARDNK